MRRIALLPILLLLIGWFIPVAAPATASGQATPAELSFWVRGQGAAGTAQVATESAPRRYRLDASLDYAAAILSVEQITYYRNQTGLVLDRIVFQVTPAHLGAFQLTASSAQGVEVAPTLNGTVLEVPLPGPLSDGDTAEIGLSYQLQVPRQAGRMSAGPTAVALGNWFPLLVPHRGDWIRHQYTEVGDPFVSEVADFDLYLSTSIPLVVAASGSLLEDTGTRFHVQAPGVRDLALSASPDYVVHEVGLENTVVRAYSREPVRSRRFAETAATFLRWYGDRFGPYPYPTLSVSDTDLPPQWAGMEYPGLIFLSAGVNIPSSFEGSSTEELIGHEVAHQWFYGLVGNDQVTDPWLDEAFAQYLPFYYYRNTAPDLFNRIWTARVAGRLEEQLRSPEALPLNSSVTDFPGGGGYATIVYRQGARFLDELRQQMGDGAFDAALADEVRIFGGKLTSPRAVLDLFQRHTSVNLNPLYARYFSYDAVQDPNPPAWRVQLPPNPWHGSVSVFVGADFPVSHVELWLDGRRLYSGAQNQVTLNLSDVDVGEYVLLAQVWDHRGVSFERAERIVLGDS